MTLQVESSKHRRIERGFLMIERGFLMSADRDAATEPRNYTRSQSRIQAWQTAHIPMIAVPLQVGYRSYKVGRQCSLPNESKRLRVK